MAELEIDLKTVASIPTLSLRGELDSYSAPRLKQVLDSKLDAGCRTAIVDLSELDYIDSAGLGILVGALKRVTETRGMIALVCPTPSVARVLHVTGLDKIFPIFDDEVQASEQARLVSA